MELRWTEYIATKRAGWSAGKWGEIVGLWRALDAWIVGVGKYRDQYRFQLSRVPPVPEAIAATGTALMGVMGDFMRANP